MWMCNDLPYSCVSKEKESMTEYRGDFRRFRRSIWPAVALLVLLTLLLQNVAGATYYPLLSEPDMTVFSPPVELESGTAGTTTIYDNSTSALVSVSPSGSATDEEDYVDNNTTDLDESADKGTHSNFTAQQYGPDLINDTLTEENVLITDEYIWISGDDDQVRKLDKSDPGGTEVDSWDTGTSSPFGVEHRIESGTEYIYVVNYDAQNDDLIKFYANNGSEVTRWDISGYSGDSRGLAWNGSRWFIADLVDDLIYQVDPADPTASERSFTYTGVNNPSGLAWDGLYLWVTDEGTNKVYQIDLYGNIQTSWDTVTNPTGIAYDTNSGHLWLIVETTQLLYEFYTNGTQINSWNPSGTNPEGVAYASVDRAL